MSFERPSQGLLVFTCDACDEVFEVTEELHDFRACWSNAAEAGWAMRNNEHYCPGCAELL